MRKIIILFIVLFPALALSQLPRNMINIVTVSNKPGSGCDVFYDGKYKGSSKDNGTYFFEYDSTKGSYNVTIKDNYDRFAKHFKFSFKNGENDLVSQYLLLNLLAVTLPMKDLNKTKKEFEQLFDKYEEAGVTDVFVNLFSDGKANFPSNVKGIRSTKNDPLKMIFETGKKRGIRIRGTINALNWGKAKGSDYRDYLVVNRADEFIGGEDGLFVSPSHPEVIRILTELTSEIAIKYRELYGIHFDYMRYKRGLIENYKREDFGFDKNTVELFKSAYGLNPYDIKPDFEEDTLHENAWFKWIGHKENMVHNLIIKLIAAIRDTNPEIIINATVDPTYVVSNGKDLSSANPLDWLHYIDIHDAILEVEYKNLKDEFEMVDINKFFGFISFKNINLANENTLQLFLKAAREQGLDTTLFLSDPTVLDSATNRKLLFNIMYRNAPAKIE